MNKAKTYFDMMAKHKLLDRVQSIQIGDEKAKGENGNSKGGSINISFYPKDMKMLSNRRIGFDTSGEEEPKNDKR